MIRMGARNSSGTVAMHHKVGALQDRVTSCPAPQGRSSVGQSYESSCITRTVQDRLTSGPALQGRTSVGQSMSPPAPQGRRSVGQSTSCPATLIVRRMDQKLS